MVKTHGLTHINLAVRDPDRSLRFYRDVFGVVEYFRDATSIQVQGPGPHDVMAFEKDAAAAGRVGGVTHFGFRLTTPDDIDLAVREAACCAGVSSRRGFRSPTSPIRTATRSRSGSNEGGVRLALANWHGMLGHMAAECR